LKNKHIVLPLLAVFLFFYLNLFANALIDDSFITLRYVKTLLISGTWGFNPGYVANAVTSPLNIILLAFTGLFLGPTVNAVIFMAVINLMVVVILLVCISRHLFETEYFGYLAASVLIFNPLIISTLGLESMLFASLYILSVYLYITDRWFLLSVALGLITITRFDGFLFFLVILPLIPSSNKLRLKFAAIYILCITPWHIFSWVHLGSFFPDSLLIKISQTPQNLSFFNGLAMYLHRYPLETTLSFLFLPFIFLLFNKQIRTASFTSFLALTSLAHFTGYSLLHVFPYHWYYATEITSIILLGSLGLGVLYKNGGHEIFQRVRPQYIAAILLILQISGMFYILARDGFSIKEMPIHTNWATHEQYKEIGEWLNRNKGENVVMVYSSNIGAEVGTIGYYCDCTLINMFSDRMRIRQYANEQSIGKGIRPLLHRINFLFLDKNIIPPQPAYLLFETPGGEGEQKTSIMKWETATKWLSRCSIKLSDY
jgi:hypothetical protein